MTKPFIPKSSGYYGTAYYFYDLNAKINYRFSEKDRLVGALAALVVVADEDALLVALGVQEVVERLLGQLVDRRLVVPAVRCADGLDDLDPPRGVGRQEPTDAEGALAEALGRVRDQSADRSRAWCPARCRSGQAPCGELNEKCVVRARRS